VAEQNPAHTASVRGRLGQFLCCFIAGWVLGCFTNG